MLYIYVYLYICIYVWINYIPLTTKKQRSAIVVFDICDTCIAQSKCMRLHAALVLIGVHAFAHSF